MKKLETKKRILMLSIVCLTILGAVSCSSDDSGESISDGDDDGGEVATLHAAFAEFDTDNTEIYIDGSDVVVETNGLPNHTTVYWGPGEDLYIEEPDVALTPSTIPGFDGSATLRVTANPELASSSTATQLGAIGISVSGAAIFNDQEGGGALSDAIASLDYTGGHIGPGVYHYHLEPRSFSNDDENLVGLLYDGVFIYGRKCNSTGGYPDDLDVSGGHVSTTQYEDEAIYHYHIINEEYTADGYAYQPAIVLFAGPFQGY
jgi:hypothetical protein